MNIKELLFKHFEKGVVALVAIFVIVRTIMTIQGGQLTVDKAGIYKLIEQINQHGNRVVDTKTIEDQIGKDTKQLAEIASAINGLKSPPALWGVNIFFKKVDIIRGEISVQEKKDDTFEAGAEITAVQVDNKAIATVLLVPPDKFKVTAISVGNTKIRATTSSEDTMFYDLKVLKEKPKPKEKICPVENLDMEVDVGRVTLKWGRGASLEDPNMKRIVPEEYLVQRLEGLTKEFDDKSDRDTIFRVPASEKRKAQTGTEKGAGEGAPGGAGAGAGAEKAGEKPPAAAGGEGKAAEKPGKAAPEKAEDFVTYEFPDLTYDDMNVQPNATYRYRVIPVGKDSKGETVKPTKEEIRTKVAVVPSNIRVQFVGEFAGAGMFRVVATLTKADLVKIFPRVRFRGDEKRTFDSSPLASPGMLIGKSARIEIQDGAKKLSGMCDRFRTQFMLVDIVPTDKITTEPGRKVVGSGDQRQMVETTVYRKTRTLKAIIVNVERNESRELIWEKIGEAGKKEAAIKTPEKKTEEPAEETKETETPAAGDEKPAQPAPNAGAPATGAGNPAPPAAGAGGGAPPTGPAAPAGPGTGVTGPGTTPPVTGGAQGGGTGETKPKKGKKGKKGASF